MSDYVPLWVKSNFSFLEGASHPQELVEQAHQLALPAIALTDRDGVHGIVSAHARAKELGTRLLVGAEVTAGDPERTEAPHHRLVLLATNRRGYGNLCQLLSKARQRCQKGDALATLGEVAGFAEDLIVLCPEPAPLRALREPFGERLFAFAARHLRANERHDEAALRAEARRLEVQVAGGNEVLYHHAERQRLQDVLTCIRHGVTLDTAGTRLCANAEHDLKTGFVMQRLFADDPGALMRTRAIAERCTFSLGELRYRYPLEKLPSGTTTSDWLRELTMRGAAERYPGGVPEAVATQIHRELLLIEELDYGGYFLTMHEIVRFCRAHDILCQGRGSAANSAVCYCLGVTAVDPSRIDLLFERFLSRERAEPPDIDLDIEHERREEVIQWVYERYGRRHAAMVANVIRYRARSAVRDVGKALGLSATTLDRMSKLLGSRFATMDHGALVHAGFDGVSRVHEHLLELVLQIEDFPRHLSIHPGGFLLGSEPVDTLVPIEPATMPGRTVIQWDKYAVEELGLFKVDLLGLGALTHIHGCFDLLREHEGKDLSMATVPKEDAATYEQISRGDTVGVFQIESRAQMSMLPRLQPRTFYDLVIEVAIVRPGPIQGDMVHPYLQRRAGEEQAEYPHPCLEQVLKKTLGVPIFQEQVMKIAVLAGGYTPGEADQLRRDMAAWRSQGCIERHREKLIGRMVQNGIPAEFAERVFSQILGFGEYGFPESHAASFALITYVTAWLRRHHPAAFTCGLLNAQPMGFYSPATIVDDGKRHGIAVRPIDVRYSRWPCTLERDDETGDLAVRMGCRYVKGLGVRERDLLAAARGPFVDFDDFVGRSRLGPPALVKLAEAGAFESFGLSRRDALWAARNAPPPPASLPMSEPEDRPHFAPLTAAEHVQWDYRRSHHSTRGHPLRSLRPELDRLGLPTAEALNRFADGRRARYVGLVICRQQPGTASGVTFYTLEDETGFVNLVVWRQVFERFVVLARTAVLLGVGGRIQSEGAVVHLVADELWAPELAFASEGTATRSFH
ncbi:MAG TPA: error-prone DNA polymerase [Planctomycetota bacterium]|nr:error-prone DNA polymerase [Planctomycetota bacterium]